MKISIFGRKTQTKADIFQQRTKKLETKKKNLEEKKAKNVSKKKQKLPKFHLKHIKSQDYQL